MNLLPGWLVSAITSRRAPQRHEQDLADMGTAFGLDASMADDAESAGPALTSAPAGGGALVRERNRGRSD